MADTLSRRVKYSGHKHQINKSGKIITKNLDMNVLNLLCSYVMCTNRNVRRGGFMNVRNFIASLDLSVYSNEPEKLERISFIEKGLEARIERGLNSPSMILNYINGGFLANDAIDMSNLATELSNQEIDFINDMVTKSLYYTFIDPEMDILTDLCIKWKAADFNEKVLLSQEIEGVVSLLYNKFRRAKVESMQNITFCLRPEKFEEIITDIRNKVCDPSNMMRTGMIGFNDLVGGGFFAGRLYMLLGITGVGKSLSMLNMLYQLKRYNTHMTAKDPTKIPAIVYITMENDIYETVERLVTISTGTDLKDHSIEELINILRTDGELYINGDSPIDIIIKFVPNRSVDTSYLYTMVEDLEDEGYEVLAVMLDHIKRIRSIESITDVRLELGAVVNECKTFAAIKNLIFITDSHLNRDAAAIIDKGAGNTASDLTRMLGKANVGESMLMLDNCDYACIINKEVDADGNVYMVFKTIKMRYKNNGREYICQPFEENNPIRFKEDVFTGIPLFLESLHNVDFNQSAYRTQPNGDKIVASNYCNISEIDGSKPITSNVTRYGEDTPAEEHKSLKNLKHYHIEDVRFMDDKERDTYYTKLATNTLTRLLDFDSVA